MTTTEDREKRPFLASEEDDADSEALAGSRRKNDSSQFQFLKSHRMLFILQMILLAGNIAFFSWNLTCAKKMKTRNVNDGLQVYTPAQSSLQYTVEEMTFAPPNNPFAGGPSPETDRAWSDLLRGGMVKLSEEELQKMNKTSIKLKDGSGYLGYLESIHMLHCVKRIYQYQYPDYYPELQDLHAFEPGHWDHCLEVLREGILCNADITVNTYYWKSPTEIHGNRTGTRKCTNWKKIQDWAIDRAVEFDGPDALTDSLVREGDDDLL
ncbi:hypothetical protein P170DRAFT_467316 [Aspergillus steynii IBT 23096]|uniref:Tat pathway signal sequence n=1 Tax=Aspergillus steynii IBT 23096 TaxID=1392250 RepID=A0A2I2FZZ3_9EURO|nr:uncharacterized protein P170DRAFT_467316 [Aspergillus steynii IBT 23096]PLB46207.1 hypothetical protein P170DRAFT_467316 [Aspergillus steynii IBT 23096]